MIITVDEQQKQIDEQQKQIDSLTAMVTDLVEANDRNLKRGHTLQGTHDYIEESNYKLTQRLLKLERFVNQLHFKIIQSKENKELKKRIEELEEMIPELEERFVRDKWELKERIEKLEAHLGEEDDDTPRWLKGKTIHEQINQVDKDSTDDCENLRGNLWNANLVVAEMNTKIKKLEKLVSKATSCE